MFATSLPINSLSACPFVAQIWLSNVSNSVLNRIVGAETVKAAIKCPEAKTGTDKQETSGAYSSKSVAYPRLTISFNYPSRISELSIVNGVIFSSGLLYKYSSRSDGRANASITFPEALACA